MNTPRWLSCHLLLIILLISLVLIFSFRDNLKSDFSRLAGEVTQPEINAEINESKKSGTEAAVAEKKYERSVPEEPAAVIEVENRAAQPQQKIDDPWSDVLDGENKQTGDSARPTTDGLPLESNFPPENYDPEFSAAADNAMQSMAMHGPGKAAPHAGDMEAEKTAIATADYYLALEDARRLYWEGKAGLAQAAYESLMFKYQDMPEAAEELGNIMLQQGNQNGATWAYKNAIPRYLNLHREQEAISIIKLLSQYDPAIAEKLQKKYW